MKKEDYEKWIKEKIEKERITQEEYRKEKRLAFKEKIDSSPILYLERAGIPKRYWNASLVNCKLPKPILDDTSKFLKGEYQGLFLTGIYGCGKTYLSCALGIELILNQYKQVKFRSVPKFLHDIRTSFNNPSAPSENAIVKELCDTEYLILDDLGAEKTSDFSLDRLYLLIDHRYTNILPTIITSNLDLNRIRDEIHDRIGSRIVEMCEYLELPEKDYRVEFKKRR